MTVTPYMLQRFPLPIGARMVSGDDWTAVHDKFRGEPAYEVALASTAQVDAAVAAARAAAANPLPAFRRYEILMANADGSPGQLMAFAEQKRMKLREEVVFFADESRSRRVFSFKARQRLDVSAEHDVYDEYGTVIGYFSKQFGASLLRSTWNLSAPGVEAVGQERNVAIAILRRIWGFIPYLGSIWVPFVFHFDFVDQRSGQIVLSSHKKIAFRDAYDVTVPDPRLDFRVAASMAVALDALQSR